MDAAAYFQGHGFENVKSLRGGIDAWSAEVDSNATPISSGMSEAGRTKICEARIEEAVKNPRNLGEMKNADAVGTVGSPDCGDMLRMWVKFKEEGGRKVIDRATFQTFGCQTAIAVASVATEMLAGKTIAEAQVDVGRRAGRAAGCVAAGEDSLRAIGGRRPARRR